MRTVNFINNILNAYRMEQKTNEHWEYMTYTVVRPDPSLKGEAELNRLGAEGWEAYDVKKTRGVLCIYTTYYLKREKGGLR